jgi:hypothetical protein
VTKEYQRQETKEAKFIMPRNEILHEDLEELGTALRRAIALDARGDKKLVGFDNQSMIGFIKMWTKIVYIVKGSAFKRLPNAFLDKSKKLPNIDSKTTFAGMALKVLGIYSDHITDEDSSAQGQFFDDTDVAMMNFFLDYRQRVVVKTAGEQAFIQSVSQWTYQSPDAAMKTVIFKNERKHH